MNDSPYSQDLKKSIERFQASLEAKVDFLDHSEVKLWIQEVREAFDDLEASQNSQREWIHRTVISEVCSNEPVQHQQILVLPESETESEIRQLLEVVKTQLCVLSTMFSTEPDARVESECEYEAQILDLIDHGVTLIARVRLLDEIESGE